MRMSELAEINHGHQAATMPNLQSGIILKKWQAIFAFNGKLGFFYPVGINQPPHKNSCVFLGLSLLSLLKVVMLAEIAALRGRWSTLALPNPSPHAAQPALFFHSTQLLALIPEIPPEGSVGPTQTTITRVEWLITAWWFGTWLLFPLPSWDDYPIWRTHMFQGVHRYTTN